MGSSVIKAQGWRRSYRVVCVNVTCAMDEPHVLCFSEDSLRPERLAGHPCLNCRCLITSRIKLALWIYLCVIIVELVELPIFVGPGLLQLVVILIIRLQSCVLALKTIRRVRNVEDVAEETPLRDSLLLLAVASILPPIWWSLGLVEEVRGRRGGCRYGCPQKNVEWNGVTAAALLLSLHTVEASAVVIFCWRGWCRLVQSSLPLSRIHACKVSDVPAGTIGMSECLICLETFEDNHVVYQLPCGHRFHSECLRTWLQTPATACPLRCSGALLELPNQRPAPAITGAPGTLAAAAHTSEQPATPVTGALGASAAAHTSEQPATPVTGAPGISAAEAQTIEQPATAVIGAPGTTAAEAQTSEQPAPAVIGAALSTSAAVPHEHSALAVIAAPDASAAVPCTNEGLDENAL